LLRSTGGGAKRPASRTVRRRHWGAALHQPSALASKQRRGYGGASAMGRHPEQRHLPGKERPRGRHPRGGTSPCLKVGGGGRAEVLSLPGQLPTPCQLSVEYSILEVSLAGGEVGRRPSGGNPHDEGLGAVSALPIIPLRCGECACRMLTPRGALSAPGCATASARLDFRDPRPSLHAHRAESDAGALFSLAGIGIVFSAVGATSASTCSPNTSSPRRRREWTSSPRRSPRRAARRPWRSARRNHHFLYARREVHESLRPLGRHALVARA